jgi:hypothetical protein
MYSEDESLTFKWQVLRQHEPVEPVRPKGRRATIVFDVAGF